MSRQLVEEIVVGPHPLTGQRTAIALPVIPEDAPNDVQEGVARQRVAATTGRCPCGAVVDWNAARVRHEDDCPAEKTRLRRACRRWLR